jgi:apolipoprotein N-acyltransferase
LLCAVSGLLAGASFPPFDLHWLSWVAMVPAWVAIVAWRPSPRVAAWGGAVHQAALFFPQSWWMHVVMQRHGDKPWVLALGGLLLATVIVMPWDAIVFAASASLARRHGALALLALPLMAAAVDILREHLALGWAWLLPGMTQARPCAVLGVAELGGVHLVSVVVLLGNAAVAALVLALVRQGERHRAAVVAITGACGVVVAIVAGGALQARHAAPRIEATRVLEHDANPEMHWGEGARIALVQGSIPQEVKMSPLPADEQRRAEVELSLTRHALALGAELIVWSESAYPDTPAGTPWVMERLREDLDVTRVGDAPSPEVLVGTLVDVPAAASAGGRYTLTNSALLVDADAVKGQADKRRLVPFGEYTPALFGRFKQIVKLSGTMKPGDSDAPLMSRAGPLGVFICYEVIFPQRVRAVARAGAAILVNPTNDGWYAGTWMPEQHARFAILRAVENRAFVLRAANSGISEIVEPSGRVAGRLEEGEKGLLLAAIPPTHGTTLYQRLGDLPLLVVGLLLLALAVPWRRGPVPPTAREPAGE